MAYVTAFRTCIRIPPRIHCICPLCHVDHIVPFVGDELDCCPPRQRKIKIKKVSSLVTGCVYAHLLSKDLPSGLC